MQLISTNGHTIQGSSVLSPKNIKDTVNWLYKVLNRPPLPECPVECERDCGVHQGKAPAYLNGRANLISWKTYQERMPTKKELTVWFQTTRGIGTIGGWNGKHWIGFIDLDTKSFDSYEAFLAVYDNWIETYPILKHCPRFTTPSGGKRILVAFESEPEWTAFTLFEGGDRMGELLSRNGSHTILPPTIGTNGNAYTWDYFIEYPQVVFKPEDIGVFPTSKQVEPQNNPSAICSPGALRLEDLGSGYSKDVLKGVDPEGDRSLSLTKAIHEWYGWENFCRKYGIPYFGSTRDLAQSAWSRIAGEDPTKWERIIKTVDASTSCTSAEHAGGGETGCWKRIYRLNRDLFQDKCPIAIYNTIQEEWGHTSAKPIEEVKAAKSADDEYKEFRGAIFSLNAIADPVEKQFKLNRMASRYNMKVEVIKSMIDTLSEKKPQRQTCFTLKELLELPEEGLSWVIPRFLPKSDLVILSAKPKVGKSLLAYEAAYSVLTGSNFLGEKVSKGKVLIIQTEESVGFSVKRRLDRRGFFDESLVNSDNLRIETFFDINDFSTLERHLEDFRPDVVIIDSLRKISRNSAISENSAEFAKPVYKMVEILRDYSASGILIHHDNKNNEAQGQDAIAGTSALAGAGWGTWRLVRASTDENNPKRFLAVTPRDMSGGGSRYAIELVEEDGGCWKWQLNEELLIDPSLKAWENKILDSLRANSTTAPNGMTVQDFRMAFDLSVSDRSLYRPLNRLVERQLITCLRDLGDRRICRYILPDQLNDQKNIHTNTPPSLCVNPGSNKEIAETLTGHESNSSPNYSHPPLNSSPIIHTPSSEDHGVNSSNLDTPVDLVCSPNYSHLNRPEGGGGVKDIFVEYNGVLDYRRNAPPNISAPLDPTPIASVETDHGEIRVGDRVSWLECPQSQQWINERHPQIMRISDDMVRLDGLARWIPLDQIRKVEG